jgi:hypothetical protein
MPEEVADAKLDHNDAGEESPIPSTSEPQDIIPTMCNTSHLSMPTRRFPPGQLSSEPRETWIPNYYHTAKCDLCQQHNTSVIQRSSRTNRQFCKACMYRNVSDGLYSVNVERLDWSLQTVFRKQRVQSTGKPRKPKQPKKLFVTLTPTRVSKRKRKEPKTPANKRIRLAEQPESENRSENSLFVADNEASDGEETDDDIGFGRLPPAGRFSSEGQEMQSEETMEVAKAVESPKVTDGCGERSIKSKGKQGNTSERDSSNSKLPPWWEVTQAPDSNVRDESRANLWRGDVRFSLIQRRRSIFSPDALEAADALLKLGEGTW